MHMKDLVVDILTVQIYAAESQKVEFSYFICCFYKVPLQQRIYMVSDLMQQKLGKLLMQDEQQKM